MGSKANEPGISEVVVLDVLLNDGLLIGVSAVVSDDEGAAALDLSGLAGLGTLLGTLLIFALSAPFSEGESVLAGDEWNFVLLGKSSDELLVFGIITVLGQNAQESVGSVE